jgi:hypothetical protein
VCREQGGTASDGNWDSAGIGLAHRDSARADISAVSGVAIHAYYARL